MEGFSMLCLVDNFDLTVVNSSFGANTIFQDSTISVEPRKSFRCSILCLAFLVDNH
jgi:hypothetical protein